MQTRLKVFALAGLLIWLNGCATRTVVIDSQSDVVRIGKGVKGPGYIWKTGTWVKVRRIEYPEGWYAGPGPKE